MSYQIVYWPGFTGRAEPALFLLEDAGQPYEINSNVSEAIEELAPDHPVFACPLLIDGDTVLSQTSVMLEYLGSKHGYSVDVDDTIAAAQFAYNVADIWRETYDGRQDDSADYLNGRFPRWLTVLENSFRSADGDFFFSDDAPTWVDFLALNIVTLAEYCWGAPAIEQMSQKPRLSAWAARMKSRLGIKAYLASDASLPVGYDEIRAAG